MKHDDFDKWCDLWDKAVDDGAFKDAPKPPVSSPRTDFFGQYNGPSEGGINSVDAQYWHDVYKAAISGEDIDDPNADFVDGSEGLMSEDHKAVSKAASDAMAYSHNPIDPTTVGKDQDIDVKGNEQEVKDIEELSEMKARLEKLESRLNANYTENKNITGVQKQIDTLRNQIDELSDSLNGFRFQPSQP